ncbi:MAG: hypothetical protein M0P39_06770 [Rhodocyclaceae bacterium]|jgi:hypothetical protein|nr:hypothetical protein [Rhodocyclaceae bacterium]
MADYLVTGKKGNGKTIFAVGVIRDALAAGKRVATNINVHLHVLARPQSTRSYIRLPDTPTVEDFEALGRGQDGVVEEDNGIIVLDESSKIFNSRSWGDKSRQPILDWLVHSRKYGWDVYMIAQGQEQLDKQLRTALLEYWVVVKRTDKWPIPLITPLSKLFIQGGLRMPKYHFGTVRHGFDRDALVVDRKWYKGVDLYAAYDTQQIFLDRDHPQASGLHTVLSHWHTHGRYLPHIPTFLEKLRAWWDGAHLPKPSPKPKHRLADLLAKLPPDQAVKHWRRLDSLGAFAT